MVATSDQRLPPVGYAALLDRARGEFLEMPGLRLTRDQARRLWGLDHAMCSELLDDLVRAGFLERRADGRYARSVEGNDTRPMKRRMARVDVDDRIKPLAGRTR